MIYNAMLALSISANIILIIHILRSRILYKFRYVTTVAIICKMLKEGKQEDKEVFFNYVEGVLEKNNFNLKSIKIDARIKDILKGMK